MLEQAEANSLEYWAAERPDAIAIVNGDRSLTFREWNDQSNRVADALAALGLQAGDRIGMRFRIDFPWFVVQRAMQKIGVQQVAVNWKLTPEEAAYIVADSGAKGLACDDANPSGWAAQNLGLLITVGQPEGSPGTRLEDLLAEGQPVERYGSLRPSLVLYTSGTTGKPRGVPPMDPASITDFDRLIRYGASVGSVPPNPPDAVVLLTLPTHHGAGPALATGALARGGTAVLLDPFDAETALRLIEQHRVQSWTGVPTMLMRVRALPAETVHQYDLSSLVALTTGAAPVPQSVKEWVVERLGDQVLWETYGCSEAGMITFISPPDQLRKPGSSGVAYDGVEIAIVDDEWNRLPTGTTGEIAVNTPMVLRGYLGAAPLGEDVIKDGFYRTGDVGHLDDDGYLFITDRAKDMIVAGGVNIYPAEIEAVILQHPDIQHCAVIGVPHDDLGEQPAAFIVAAPGRSMTADDVLHFLDGRLATFKKPRLIEFVDELPISPMGKVLKNELRKPYWEGRDRRV